MECHTMPTSKAAIEKQALRRAAVEALVKYGLTQANIARALGVVDSTVYKDRVALGLGDKAISPEREKQAKALRVAKAKAMLAEGAPVSAIERATGVSRHYVEEYLRVPSTGRNGRETPVTPTTPPALAAAYKTSDADFCLCLNERCVDYVAHEDEILLWTARILDKTHRARIADAGVDVRVANPQDEYRVVA